MLCSRGFKTSGCIIVLVVLSFGVPAWGQTCSIDNDCDDGLACTPNRCVSGVCVFAGNNCDNGIWCDGPEWCDAWRCEGGSNPGAMCAQGLSDCLDGGSCTGSGTGTCQPCASVPACGAFIGDRDCAPLRCSELHQQCVECDEVLGPHSGSCDDSLPCNGVESCNLGTYECDPGIPITCDDPPPACNTLQCNNATGQCDAVPISDGQACDDLDSCTPIDECLSGVCEGFPTDGCIDLEFRAFPNSVIVGETVQVELWATSNGCPSTTACVGSGFPVSTLKAAFTWDPDVFELLASDDPDGPNPDDPCDDPNNCFACQFPSQEYNWSSSVFPFDCALGDAINSPCISGEVPGNDGDAFYVAWSQIVPCTPAINACVLPSGFHVTTLKFKAIGPSGITDSEIAIQDCLVQTRTLIGSGAGGGGDIFGNVISSGMVEVKSACIPPTVTAEGCRYLGITPPAGTEPVAFLVTGVEADVSCVSKYVSYPANRMGDLPAYRLPSEWGDIHVRGHDLMSNRTFSVRTDCDPANPGTVLSEPANAKLWWWGEINLDGPPGGPNVDFSDITAVVDAFRGIFNSTTVCTTDADCVAIRPLQSCDLAAGRCRWSTVQTTDIIGNDNLPEGCMPDGVIDFSDISREVDAFRGLPYPCPVGCP